jgi:hypothetical protein
MIPNKTLVLPQPFGPTMTETGRGNPDESVNDIWRFEIAR